MTETKWEERLWEEIDGTTGPEKIVLVGEVITHLMRNILPMLGNARRMTAVHLVESGEYTPTRLAESIGARPGTIQRLIEEGRKLRRLGETE